MKSVSSIPGSARTIELAADESLLRRLHLDLEGAELPAEFAVRPGDAGYKGVEEILPLLLVAVTGLAEVRRLVKILVDARVRRSQTFEIRATDEGNTVVVTNSRNGDLEKTMSRLFPRESE